LVLFTRRDQEYWNHELVETQFEWGTLESFSTLVIYL